MCRYCNPWDLGYLFGGSCCNRKLKECQDEQVCCQQEVGGQCQYGEGDCDYHEDCEGKTVYKYLSDQIRSCLFMQGIWFVALTTAMASGGTLAQQVIAVLKLTTMSVVTLTAVAWKRLKEESPRYI